MDIVFIIFVLLFILTLKNKVLNKKKYVQTLIINIRVTIIVYGLDIFLDTLLFGNNNIIIIIHSKLCVYICDK